MKKKNRFGWTNPNTVNQLNINVNPRFLAYVEQQIINQMEQQRIINRYLFSTVFFTRHAGLYYNRYKNMDFEIMRIEFTHPRNPLIPYFTLLHTIDDPRDPNNMVSISLYIPHFNIFR